ncbi:MAG: hypothetical protein AAF658_07595 [Myxococcota bacterium]
MLDRVEMLDVGESFACAFRPGAMGGDDHVLCWGDNMEGQLQNSSRVDSSDWGYALPVCGPATPADGGCMFDAPFLGSTDLEVVDLAVGARHACAVVNETTTSVDGRLYCWGDNGNGQLGRSIDADNQPPTAAIFAVGSPPELWENTASVEASNSLTCAIRSDRDGVFCFGSGLLDNIDAFNADELEAAEDATIPAHAVAVDDEVVCALTLQQNAGTWERNVVCAGNGDAQDRLGVGATQNGYQAGRPVCRSGSYTASPNCVPYATARMRACAELTAGN